MASTSAVAACNTDAKTVQTAVAAYDAQAGNEPSGTIAVSAAGVASDVAPGTALEQLVTAYLKNWPDNTGANYSITLDNPSVASPAIQTPGQVDVQVGGGAINPYSASACVGATT
jgi:hypothetical protein